MDPALAGEGGGCRGVAEGGPSSTGEALVALRNASGLCETPLSNTSPQTPPSPGSAGEVFRIFLRLGLTSFGGPIAHLAYFREEFVRLRGWLDDAHFAQLLSVCQFLPGPASSQMCFAIGLFRGGWAGALAAFVAFTLPSALLMFGFALIAPHVGQGVGTAAVHGLKLVAVVVVAHGLLGMIRQLAPDAPRVLIAAGAAVLIVSTGSAWAQLGAIALGAMLGWCFCRQVNAPLSAAFPVRYGRRGGVAFLLVFLAGLAGALMWPAADAPTAAALAAAFYKAGALVFGGGHVVLSLLQPAVVDTGWVHPDTFLAGYGAAQAMPGPMFSLAAFVGAEVPVGWPAAASATLALLAVFLPGILLLLAVLPLWEHLARRRWATRGIAGINAAVVGLLIAAFYTPVWTEGVHGVADFVIALIGFALLTTRRVSALWIVSWCVAASIVARLLS
ncbi:chromate efflux transporter [Stenotrophomonas pictorum]|uniref:chromate efflux transporter n=1 Tax=Stenotrophomonas pictorum TaxID=86184 RepID=UPI00210BF46E|nr:chromate efflux transporter [Stenotrophomonas pictorum]